MPRKILAAPFVVALVAFAPVSAATVSVSQTMDTPSAAAIAAGVPANIRINNYFLHSDADVLAIDRVIVRPFEGSLFQVAPPFGADNEPPPPAFIALNRALEADSWITTPGATSLLGPGPPGDGDLTTFGDLSNEWSAAELPIRTPGFPEPLFHLAISHPARGRPRAGAV